MAGAVISRVLGAVAALALLAGLAVALSRPSAAQLFNFGGNNGRSHGWDWFERQPDQQQQQQQPTVQQDYWHAPPPRKPDPGPSTPAGKTDAGKTDAGKTEAGKTEAGKTDASKTDPAVTTPILVLGDAMADWLGYGLEQAYADAPEIGILRRFKTWSGLIRTDAKADPRGEYPDWPQAARDYIATQKPKFVLFMIGTNDRRQLREITTPRPKPAAPAQAAPGAATPAAAPPGAATPPGGTAPGTAAPGTTAPGSAAPRPGEHAASDDEAPPADDTKPAAAPPVPPPAPAPTPAPAPVVTTLQFHTDGWAEAYSRRIDETIAALKTSGVPVFWVGLPPVRGQRTGADIAWLNELYRSRADKAGIIFIDVTDGFVDEEGHYVQYGPDVDGQTRRLRSGDGVFFTQAGAKLLAHYVQREIQRWLNAAPAPVAVAVPEEPKEQAAPPPPPGKPGPLARPLSGPVVPLTAERGIDANDLLGGGSHPAASDVIAAKVLVEGTTLPAPAGRADDFVWPRRDVAPPDADPVVAETELPMTPMTEAPAHTEVATASPDAPLQPSAAKPVRRRPAVADLPSQQGIYRPDARRPQQAQQQPWSFNSIFGGQSWFRR